MNETVRLVLTIIQVIVSLVLILTVIFQSGKRPASPVPSTVWPTPSSGRTKPVLWTPSWSG